MIVDFYFTFKFDKEHSQNIQHFLYSSSTVCSALWIAQEYFNDWATNLNHLELQQFIYIWWYPNTEYKLYNVAKYMILIRFSPLHVGKIKYWDVSFFIETKSENGYIYQDC